ncbi:protein vav-like protein [Leptotrombidium deliense]|uniref:Protein vav-like protein n=1 Tax=Leptotrombidium deliense TaxID=299467 RepID=A0A443SBE1_9ACAR|nr:protein vav-like protein [Leptotrombidium deliense]
MSGDWRYISDVATSVMLKSKNMDENLWKECGKWLIACNLLPFDHRINWKNAQIIDLVNSLRDGVLLCQLLNVLQPNCIDMKEVSLRPQMSQFLCLKNIRTFLQTCNTQFDIAESDLFEPYMLFDYTDFGRVLHTLSVLSHSPKAQITGVKGFPIEFSRCADYYNDDVYKNLEEVALESSQNGSYAEDTLVAFEFPSHASHSRRTHEEDIYEDLCYVTLRVGKDLSTEVHFPVVPIEKRDYCIKELVETEKNYIEALNMIVRHFMRPLKGTLREDDRKIVFLHIKELLEIHTGFHSDLFKACTTNQHRISQCFLHWKEKFVIYGDYCANLPKAQDLVEELCVKSEVINQSVLRCQTEASDGKFKLRDLLSLPMQRILKYHLLLNELLKNTTETHDDFIGLQRAYESMIDLGQFINEVKRDSETIQIISDIQASITDIDLPENTELKDYGRLLKDGEVKIRSQDNKLKNRYIFIFDKVMLMCKSIRGEQYSFKEAIALADYKVEGNPVVTNSSKYIKDKWSHYWHLVHKHEKSSYIFCAKTDFMKRKWVEAIEKAFDNVNPSSLRNTDHSFIMYTFETPTVCADCEKWLRGTFFQGYKCTVCNVGVHKCCIPSIRSCGAPSLPPRPPLPPSSPSVISSYSTDDDPLRSFDLTMRKVNGSACDDSKVRAVLTFEGDASLGQLSFEVDDILQVFQKEVNANDNKVWYEGKSMRTGDEGIFPAECVEPLQSRISYEDPGFTVPQNQDNTSNVIDFCINFDDYLWFAGSMDRETAQAVLEKLLSGAFLVRISPKQRGSYAISLNYNCQVKHMRVCITEEGHYYLSHTKFFKTIADLVKWYEEHSLAESFNGLNITLTYPYKKLLSTVEPIGYAIAVYSFTGESSNLLTLRKGDRIAILSKSGEEKGWWKGQINDRIGYFPLAYVTEIH